MKKYAVIMAIALLAGITACGEKQPQEEILLVEPMRIEATVTAKADELPEAGELPKAGELPETDEFSKTEKQEEEDPQRTEASESGEASGENSSKERYAAYRSVLEGIYSEHIFPGNKDYGYDELFDITTNQFAVYDIDKDGAEELIIAYTTTYNAGMVTIIYDFDEDFGKVREELAEYPSLTFYDNGAVQADLSHNHGLGGEFWPYTLYQYDQETDTYTVAAEVDAWDKSYVEKDYEGNAFPQEADTDGDGIVYYIMTNGIYEHKDPVDLEEYEQWRNSCIGGAAQMKIPFANLTEENIAAVGE